MNPETPQTSTPTSTPEPAIVPANSVAVATGSKTMAVVTLVLSIAGFLTGFIFIGFALVLVGIILAIVGLVKHKAGKRLNIASIIISGVCLLSLPITLAFTLAAYNGVTSKANQAVQQSELQTGN